MFIIYKYVTSHFLSSGRKETKETKEIKDTKKTRKLGKLRIFGGIEEGFVVYNKILIIKLSFLQAMLVCLQTFKCNVQKVWVTGLFFMGG